MTVAVATRRVEYAADGSTNGPFAVTFPFFEIEVYLDGELVDPADYSISQTGGGGTTGDVYFDAVPTGTVVIVGATERSQQTDFISSDTVEPEAAELALDRLTMIAQELERQIGLVLRLPSYGEGTDDIDLGETEDALVLARGDGGLKIHDGGAGYVTVDADGVVSVSDVVPEGTAVSRISPDPNDTGAYTSSTFLDVVHDAAGGASLGEVWPTDALFVKMAAVGLIKGEAKDTAPADTTKLWLDTSVGTSAPGTWKKYSGGSWTATTATDVATHVATLGATAFDPTTMTNDQLDGMAADIATRAPAIDLIRDAALNSGLDNTNVRAIVNAIQTDASGALADLQSSMAAGPSSVFGEGAAVSLTSPIASGTVIDTGVLWGQAQRIKIAFQNFYGPSVNALLDISFDGGSTWTAFLSGNAASNAAMVEIGLVGSSSTLTENYPGSTGGNFSAFLTAGSYGYDNTKNIKFRLRTASGSGNVTFDKFKYGISQP